MNDQPREQKYVLTDADVATGSRGLRHAYQAGDAARRGLLWSADTYGKASTGTPIAQLVGAPLDSARMAWLGFGAKAAGGGGMTVGRAVLAAGTIAPALVVAGGTLAVIANRAKARSVPSDTAAAVD